MYNFKRINPTNEDWKVIESTYDATVDKTQALMKYVELQGNEPFIAKVYKNDSLYGYFVGEICVRAKVKILGSPFYGLGIAHQGLSMLQEIDGYERITIYKELARWVFNLNYAIWIEIEDWQLSMDDCEGKGVRFKGHDTGYTDLTPTEEAIEHSFEYKSCRYMMNKAKKLGVTIRETLDSQTFLDLHWEQHKDVMSRKGVETPKPKSNLQKLIDAAYPDHLLLMEAVSPEGEVVSTAMTTYDNHNAHFFARANFGKDLKWSANELLMWESMKYCKEKGARFFNHSGVGSFKMKFGSVRLWKPRLYFAKYAWLTPAREVCWDIYHRFRRLFAKKGLWMK
ncbi:MAG: GNAT family N-acetyltransferase [Paludibacteraceae bacterium]|nr:GNAT family N-acetyltransferase [Paludibacteraceae bacterium]